ncbi:cytochrome b5 domain-containing protein [Arsenicicoccus cauae]|uniref:cytochrome b5 domain-containing protein n=1 Tax=Arsenicicoccus cauae TaxID=2663847 RepID=UPI00370D8A1A
MTRSARVGLPVALGLALAATVSACGASTTETTQSATTSAGATSSAASSAGPASGTTSSDSATSTATGTSTGTSDAGKTYTMAVVNDHDNETSCWTVINDQVYDVTSWIGQHPGGPERIKGLCGQDGTAQFTGQHQGADLPQKRLASFRIGTLAK